MVRAKFKVTNVVRSEFVEDGGIVVLHPVIDGSEENKHFYKLTPAGSIRLETININALNQFVMGKEYYIDFTSADEDAQ